MAVNRAALQNWLEQPSRTWRWHQEDDPFRYQAVEATRTGTLRWYRWTHEFGEQTGAGGGEHTTHIQTREAFLRDGPMVAAPAEVVESLTEWLAASALQGNHRPRTCTPHSTSGS